MTQEDIPAANVQLWMIALTDVQATACLREHQKRNVVYQFIAFMRNEGCENYYIMIERIRNSAQ